MPLVYLTSTRQVSYATGPAGRLDGLLQPEGTGVVFEERRKLSPDCP